MEPEELVEAIFQRDLKIKKLNQAFDKLIKDYNIDPKVKDEYFRKVGLK